MRFAPPFLFAGFRRHMPPAASAAPHAKLVGPPTAWNGNPTRLIAAGGVLVIAMVVATAWALLANLRNEQIEKTTLDLESMTLVLAEQIDRSLQSIELIQNGIIERVRSRGIGTAVEFERRMSDFDTHRLLREQIGAQPHIDAIVLTDAQGEVVNFTRAWPLPDKAPNENRAFETFQRNPGMVSFIGQPHRHPQDRNWILPIARRLDAANGSYLGAVIGVMRVSYFEQYFKSVAGDRDRSIALFKSGGAMVARFPADEKLRHVSFANREIFRDVLSIKSYGTVRQQAINDPRILLISGRTLAHYPMVVVVTRSIDEALTSWRYAALYLGGAAGAIALTIGSIVILVTRRIRRDLTAQNRRLDAALNNMSQGLTMFDRNGRLIVCNNQYREMYNLPPDILKPGTSVGDLLRLRTERNTCFPAAYKSAADYVDELFAKIREGNIYSFVSELSDGRTIAVVNHPMTGGGWVATHEDITEARRREQSFRLLFEGNPIPMWVYDLETLRILAVNDAAVEHYGYSREQFLAMSILDLRPPEEQARLFKLLHDIEAIHHGELSTRHRKASGELIDVIANFRVLNYEGQNATLVAVQDITSRKLAEEQLRRAERFLDTIVENVPAAILVKEVVDPRGDVGNSRYTLINRATEELLGISRDYIVGKSPAELFPKEQADSIVALNKASIESGDAVTRVDHPVETFLNGRRLVTAKGVAIRNDAGQPQYLVTVLEDVTDRRSADQRISRMAHHDTLTDLPNRVTFNDAIDAAIARAEKSGSSFALLSLDLDGFKEANDSYGHSAGDALLREVARRLQLAADNTFVARIGGDEFTVIVTGGPQPETATAVAERLIDCISDDITIDDRRVSIGATVGGAVYPTDGADAKTLMSNADMALYRAKAAARGSVVFYEPSMGEQLRERRALQDELRLAITREELLLHYQPQKTMAGEVVGFEALARWPSPKRGLVSPAQFIPIAEESGLIIPLGELVLRQACREATHWHAPLTVAVNISPAQFRTSDLPQLVQSVLLETGLPPERLELEVTESVLIDDFSRAISILGRLKALGVRIALDDFGSGYSSLSYLHSFSFDKIKIDRTFIGDIETNRHSKAIVRAVIDLGHSLNVPILAEGVETPAQLALLERSGCDEVQGYLTGRPRPIADYEELTGAKRARQRHYAAAS